MNEILLKPNGANFYKADLHLHTPFDKQFTGKPSGGEPEKKAFIREYFNKAIEKNLGILAITEHNDASWIPLYQEINKEEPFKSIILFPGVEITSKEGIHLLVLFNPKTLCKDIDSFLIKIGLEKNRIKNGGVVPSEKTYDEIISLIEKDYCHMADDIKHYSAIAIAAHVDSENGLMKRENVNLYYKNPCLISVQINHPYSSLKEGLKTILNGKDPNYGGKRVAVIESSDARSLDDIGKNASYIKLSSPTVEGLRQAFLDPDSRIRHHEVYSPEEYSKILAMKVEGGYLNDLEIHFNENLNCIIGGKGTGKSTIIEVIRYALGKEPKTDYASKQHQEIMDDVFQISSKVTFIIYSSLYKKKYLVETIYNEKPVVRDFDSNEIIENFPSYTIMPSLDIYGQKEIYELSSDPRFQFSLLERFYGDDIKELQEQEKEIVSKLDFNKNDLIKTRKQLSETEGIISELPSLKEKFKIYKQSDIEKEFKTKNIYEKEKQIWDSLSIEFDENVDIFKELLNKTYFEDLIKDDFDYVNEDIFKSLNKKLKDIDKSLKAKLREIINLLNESQVTDLKKEWDGNYKAQNDDYNEKLRNIKIDKSSSFNPLDYTALEKKIFSLEQKEKVVKQLNKNYTELNKKRNELLVELKNTRTEIYRKQKEVCDVKINKVLDGILKVEIKPEGRKDEFITLLQSYKTGVQKNQFDKIINSSNFTVMEFSRALWKGGDNLVSQFGISQTAADNISRTISDNEIYEIETFNIPTQTIISLNVGDEYKDTGRLSVGQRCTALLTMILLENKDPLIIDQPEDDLDKSFIFEDIVAKLRTQKEKRQFIVATHDSNISVLGDAELMVILKATNSGIIPADCKMSSIDDNTIKKDVEMLLEGGKEAFEKRKNKYGF